MTGSFDLQKHLRLSTFFSPCDDCSCTWHCYLVAKHEIFNDNFLKSKKILKIFIFSYPFFHSLILIYTKKLRLCIHIDNFFIYVY